MASSLSDLAKANKEHWDKMASTYDSKPWQLKLLQYVTKELRAHPDFFGIPKEGNSNVRLLDYACGTGNVSRALGPFVKSCLGIDLSPNMVSTFNSKAAAAGLDKSACHAHEGNLLASEPYVVGESGEKDQSLLNDDHFNNFDACIVGLGFHHFENFAKCLESLSKRLKSGGVNGIIDLAPNEDHFARVPESIRRSMHASGFTEEQMAGYMKEAGLVDFAFMWLPEKTYMEIQGIKEERSIFFARGRKP